MGYLQVHVPSSILCQSVNISSCLLSVSPIFQETTNKGNNIANLQSDFFTVHKLCLIIANYSLFTVSL